MFQCQLCPTTCGRKTDLRIHMQKLHNKEKTSTLRCRKCSKNFDDRYNYKLHMKTHEGEKTYSCGKIWLFQKPRHLLFSTQLYLHFALVILWSLFCVMCLVFWWFLTHCVRLRWLIESLSIFLSKEHLSAISSGWMHNLAIFNVFFQVCVNLPRWLNENWRNT